MTTPGAAHELTTLLQDFLAEHLADDPVAASDIGLTEYDSQLPDLSAGSFTRRAQADAAWLASLTAVPDVGLDAELEADRDLVLAELRRRGVLHERQHWRRDPDLYTATVLSGVFDRFLHRKPDEDLASDICARMLGAPELLAEGRANLDPELASPLLLRRAVGMARGGAAYFRDEVAGQLPDGPLRAEVAEAGAVAAQAYDGWAEHLSELAERAHGDWAIGEPAYSALLQGFEGLSYGAAGLHQRGAALYDDLAAEMAELTGAVRAAAGGDAGDTDWRTLVAELSEDAPPTPEAMRAEYAAATERARGWARETGLVPFADGERCAVDPAPEFMRGFLAVAFYLPPPAVGGNGLGHFMVPYPPAGSSPEEVRGRLASNARYSIPTVAVHEAYPGHHWHLSWLAQQQPRLLRFAFTSSYFIEGWGLYVEQVAREAGFFADPRAAFGQVEARLFRAARVVVDTALHTGEMTVEQAVTHLVEGTGLSAETARAEVTRYCAWPTQAASYLIGAVEIGRLAQEWVADGGDLAGFHGRIAGTGMLPLGIAERLLRADGWPQRP